MITSLKYSVTFPSTGRTLARDVKFDAGMTAITGPNEAGKSYVIEMIRFCLFGTAALRGAADDYKTLKAEMTFVCRGKTYRVERRSGNAKVFEGSEALAVGVKPVNAKILAILGFGLDVFDVACVTNQGEVERLGNMKPAERKRMVDQVIGLDRIDEVSKWVGEQMTFANREADVLERGLVEPAQPVQPLGYQPSTTTQSEVNGLKILWDEVNVLKGWLSQTRKEPVAPQDPQTQSVEELEQAVATRAAWETEQRRVRALPVVDYDVDALRGAWAAWDLWEARVAFETAHPRSLYTLDDLQLAHLQWAQLKDIEVLEAQIKKLKSGQSTTCPHCKTDFVLAYEALEHAEAALAKLPRPEQPTIPENIISPACKLCEDWLNPDTLARWEELKDVAEAPPPSMPRAKLTVPAGAITTAERDALLATEQPADVRAALAARKVYEADKTVFDREIAIYTIWKAERDVKQARFLELAGVGDELHAAQERLQRDRAYELALASYEMTKADYDLRKAELEDKRAEALGWKNSKAFLAELRTRIKTYLVPSLSKVASHLLAQMTGGQRSSIVVDEEFEVMVDGQALGTLSGSGKACANLALRIGLGQVLTNNVLSVFIGDEIDASMDDDRADFTQASLQSLANRISQILLITHKVPTADHVVTFEGDDEQFSIAG